MECARARELLPWLLNDSLEAAERAELLDHLRECAGCREELKATAAAGELFGTHLPVETLLGYAFEEERLDRELVERHLAICAACRDELALVQQSRAAAEPVPVASRRGRRRALPWMAIAAALLAVLAVAGWFWTWTRSQTRAAGWEEERAGLEEELSSAQQENHRLTEQLAPAPEETPAAPSTQVAEGGAPPPQVELNVPVVELIPEDFVVRGVGGRRGGVEIPAGASSATLVLVTDAAQGYWEYRAEILGPDGHEVWSATGLRPLSTGDFSLHLAPASLPEGHLTLNLYGRGRSGSWQRIESYGLHRG